MIKQYFLATVLCFFFFFEAQAQFTDDFNWVDDDDNCPSWWTTWPGGCPLIGALGGCNPPYGGYIPGDGIFDSILDLGNKTSGEWYLDFCMYVPSGKEAYFNLQGEVPPGGGEWIVGNIFFNQSLVNPGLGAIDNSALGIVTFDFPHDQWFDVEMNFNILGGISNATWEFIVDGGVVIPAGTAFTDGDGNIPTSLGGVNFYSISTDNEFMIDQIVYTDVSPGPGIDSFFDDMEYDTPLASNEWWSYGPIAIDDTYVHSDDKSGYMHPNGSATSILNLGNKIFGVWHLGYFIYIPSGKEASFAIHEGGPLASDGLLMGNFIFNEDGSNSGIGRITDTSMGDVSFTFPHDEWFFVNIGFDISAGISLSTWVASIDNTEVVPAGTPFTNSDGDIPSSLGGVIFTSPSPEGEYWIDDMAFSDLIIGTEDFTKFSFSMSPNPASNHLSISSHQTIESIQVFSLDGKLALESDSQESIDITALHTGIYFVAVTAAEGRSIQKLIKE